jgi:hypothetical protein
LLLVSSMLAIVVIILRFDAVTISCTNIHE